MAYTIEDFGPYIKKLKEKQQVRVLDHMRQVQGVGAVISELQADPKWAIYGNHLEALKQRYKLSQEGAERLLLDDKFMASEEYGRTKIQQAGYRGIVKGIELALNLARELIEHGEQAAKLVADLAEEKK